MFSIFFLTVLGRGPLVSGPEGPSGGYGRRHLARLGNAQIDRGRRRPRARQARTTRAAGGRARRARSLSTGRRRVCTGRRARADGRGATAVVIGAGRQRRARMTRARGGLGAKGVRGMVRACSPRARVWGRLPCGDRERDGKQRRGEAQGLTSVDGERGRRGLLAAGGEEAEDARSGEEGVEVASDAGQGVATLVKTVGRLWRGGAHQGPGDGGELGRRS